MRAHNARARFRSSAFFRWSFSLCKSLDLTSFFVQFAPNFLRSKTTEALFCLRGKFPLIDHIDRINRIFYP